MPTSLTVYMFSLAFDSLMTPILILPPSKLLSEVVSTVAEVSTEVFKSIIRSSLCPN